MEATVEVAEVERPNIRQLKARLTVLRLRQGSSGGPDKKPGEREVS